MIFNQFDGLYIINLPSRVDRRMEMADQLERVGLSFESEGVFLFDAVRPSDAAAFPSIGAHGCFLSHLGVLEDACRRDKNCVLLLEDDCNFSDDLINRMVEISQLSNNQQWDLLYGGTLTDFSTKTVSPQFMHVRFDQPLMGSHFIAIQGRVLPLLIEYLKAMLERPGGDPKGGPMHVDGAYSWFRKDHPDIVTLLAVPAVAYQRSSRTDIHTNKWFDRLPLIRQIVAIARKGRNKL